MAKRPSILDGVYLADGRHILDAARSNGCSETLLRKRLNKGEHPEQAVRAPLHQPNAYERGEYPTPFNPLYAQRPMLYLRKLRSKADSVRKAETRLAQAYETGTPSAVRAAEQWINRRKFALADCWREVNRFRALPLDAGMAADFALLDKVCEEIDADGENSPEEAL